MPPSRGGRLNRVWPGEDAGDAWEGLGGQGYEFVTHGRDLLGAQSPAFGTEDVGGMESELGRLLLLAFRASYTCGVQ